VIFLLVCLAVQAILLGVRLDLLDLWTDELVTLQTAPLPVREILRAAAADIHPPLYYLLQHFWLQVPLPVTPSGQLRMLSAGFALLGTVVLDRLWGRRLDGRWRRWLLVLWVASPCLVLYGRMARSYSLQVLVVMVAVYFGWQFLEGGTRRDLLLLAAATALTFYTHYVPGLALAAAATVALLRRRKFGDLAMAGAVAAILYLPWAWTMADAAGKWARSGQAYTLTGSAATEWLLKAGFAAVSLSLGESLPWWRLAIGLAVLAPAAWLATRGASRERDAAWWCAAMAAVGFFGVARWVSYAFVPARLLFLVPFLLLLFVRGCELRPRPGIRVAAALLVVWAAGLWGYFDRGDYLNKGYAMPFHEIGERIREGGPGLVLCDSLNTDYPAIQHYLGPGHKVMLIGDAGAEARVEAALADPSIRMVWMVRNLHDISAGRSNGRISARLGGAWHTERVGYLPLSGFERLAAGWLTGDEAPRYFYEAARFRR
jgi:hypothetical protein